MRVKENTNNGVTLMTAIRLPLADDAILRTVCAEHGVTKTELMIAGVRREMNKLLAKKRAAKPAASVEVSL